MNFDHDATKKDGWRHHRAETVKEDEGPCEGLPSNAMCGRNVHSLVLAGSGLKRCKCEAFGFDRSLAVSRSQTVRDKPSERALSWV